jgi:HPt (histidine-containing phosphotransfer) domain-containing protein
LSVVRTEQHDDVEPDDADDAESGLMLEKAPDRGMFGSRVHDPSILDVRRLDDACMGIATLREALITTFLGDLRPRLDRMEMAILNHSSQALEHEAHGLRGMAATIGAVGCVGVFEKIEYMAHDERFDGVEDLIEQARRETRRVEDHILALGFRPKNAA